MSAEISAEAGDDVALVRAFLGARSETNFRALYRRHAPRMLALARRLTAGTTVSAEECVQEAWLRAVPALPRFEWRSSLATWLGGFVMNVFRELWRVSATGEHQPAETEGPALTEDPLLAIDLAAALQRLPDGYRSVLALHDLAGFTHAEIGTILGVEPGTSKSQLNRARARVRALLSDGIQGAGD